MTPAPIRNTRKQGSWLLWATVHYKAEKTLKQTKSFSKGESEKYNVQNKNQAQKRLNLFFFFCKIKVNYAALQDEKTIKAKAIKSFALCE